MNRARNFPPSPAFAEMTTNLANQLADFEAAGGSDEAGKPFFDKWCATEKALTHTPALTVGDLLLKIEVLCKIAEDSEVEDTEWQALGRDAEQLNGPGMAFFPEAWLRRWTHRGGGYVRTDSGIAFVATEPQTTQQRYLMDELRRANGSAAVAAYLDSHQGGETIRETWDRLKSAYEVAHTAANAASIACEVELPDQKQALVEASDDANHHEHVAWCALLRSPAPDLAAVSWKMIELFGPAGRPDGEPIDKWLREFTDVIIDDLARLNGKGSGA